MDATATAPHAAHADHHSPEEMRKHVRRYMAVGATLFALTVVTVLVAKLDVSHNAAIAIALAVATVKASLVGAIFMHLIDEKKVIYWCLFITATFFMLVMLLPIFTDTENARVPMPYELPQPAAAASHSSSGH